MTKLTRLAVEGLGPEPEGKRHAAATSSRWAWCSGCTIGRSSRRCGYIDDKFGKKPEIAEANTAALKAGYHYGETVEAINTQYHVPKAKLPPGKYTQHHGQHGAGLRA